jgi:hypothetical protein
MVKPNPLKLRKTGNEQFVVLTSEEYAVLCRRIQDAEDVLALRLGKAADAGKRMLSVAEARRKLGIGRSRAGRKSTR